MNLVWGTLPEDLSGHAYFLSPNGTPTGTYPIPEFLPNGDPNPDWGGNVLAGYGDITRIDFHEPGKVNYKGRMLQAPSWFADTALAKATGRMGGKDTLFSNVDVAAVAQQMMEEGSLHHVVKSDAMEAAAPQGILDKLRHPKILEYLEQKAEGLVHAAEAKVEEEIITHTAKLLKHLGDMHTKSLGGPSVLEQLKQIFFSFNYGGTPRYSLVMGFAEQLNTALTPVNFTGTTDGNRLLATSDFGRHWYIDPVNLTIAAPMAPIKDYAMSKFPLPWVFPIVLGTAHPVFDPHTKEYFGFNFTQNPHVTTHPRWNVLAGLLLAGDAKTLKVVEDWIEKELVPLSGIHNLDHVENDLKGFMQATDGIADRFRTTMDAHLQQHEDDPNSWVHMAKQLVMGMHEEEASEKQSGAPEEAYFTHYTLDASGQPAFKKAQLVDDKGEAVVITQAAHQLGLTQEYLFVINAAFKTTMDVSLSLDFLFNYPILWEPLAKIFKKLGLNITKGGFLRLLRLLTTSTQDPFTDVYVAKRSDIAQALGANGDGKVTVKHFRNAPEYVHALANYLDEGNQITYYSMNNAALCVAEWLRWYDSVQTATDVSEPLQKDFVGMVNSTAMDVGRMGKYVLDMNNGSQAEPELKSIPGENTRYHNNQNETEPSTWGIGLYGFQGYLSAVETTDQIENIFVISGSPDYKRVTEFIYRLYEVYPNREIPAETILQIAQKELPMSLLKLQTKDMSIPDYFVFPDYYFLYSTQFIPKPGAPAPGQDKSLHGYVLCLMINQEDYQGKGDQNYFREFWLFDAADLKQGPLCVLGKPNMDFVFGLHSAWMPDLPPTVPAYTQADMQDDYGYLIQEYKQMYLKYARKNAPLLLPVIHLYFHWLNQFMENEVYTPFQQYKAGN